MALMSQGHHGEAEKAYRAAIDDGLALLKDHPDDGKASHLLGTARLNLAKMLGESKRVAEPSFFHSAVTNLEAAARPASTLPRRPRKSPEQLRDSPSEARQARGRRSPVPHLDCHRVRDRTALPEEFEARSQLATSPRNLGRQFDLVGRGDEAERLYLASMAERKAIARRNQDVPEYRVFLASSHSSLGLFYRDRNRYREADEAYRAAIAEFQTLVREHPDVQVSESTWRTSAPTSATSSWSWAVTGSRARDRLANGEIRVVVRQPDRP